MSIGITVSFVDEAGEPASTSFNVPAATTLTQAGFAAQAMALLLNDITDGRIAGLTLSYPIPLPTGLRGAALDTARAFAGARFSFETVDGYVTRMNVPTRKESIIVDGGKNVILTDTGVANYLAAMTDGIDLTSVGGTGTIQATDTHDSNISILLKAVESSKGT